jgi:hypothetical protein
MSDEQTKRIAKLESVLSEIAAMFEGEVDVVDGSYGEPSPNRAMQITSMIDEVIGK